MKFLQIFALLLIISACSNQRDPDDEPTAPVPPGITQGSGKTKGLTPYSLQNLISNLNLKAYHERGFHGQNVKIAIFDNGFAGLEESLGVSLPGYLTIRSPLNQKEPQETPHGRMLAEVLYALTSGSLRYSADILVPDISLFNTNGLDNFKAAVETVIKEHFDIVLYAQIWEFGGNLDGQGFINDLVSKATANGILWVNAVGNYGKASYSGVINFKKERQIRLPYQDKYLRFSTGMDKSQIKIVLAWSDFTNNSTYRTDQDLDLILEDSNGNILQQSALIQDGKDHPNEKGYSAHAREAINISLPKGTYNLRVIPKSRDLKPNLRFWISITGGASQIIDQPSGCSFVMIPADNPNVLSVGASDADFSSCALQGGFQTNAKPEISSVSFTQFSDGTIFEGTSSASAITTAALAVYASYHGRLSREKVVELIRSNNLSSGQLSPQSVPVLRLRSF